MGAVRSPLEERVYSRRRPVASTGVRRRRVCVERSRAPLSFFGGSFLGLVFREGEGATFSLGRSVAPPLLVCKKRRVFIRLNRHVGYYYYYVIAPGSGSGLAAATARPSK